jgi:hypothetical protein
MLLTEILSFRNLRMTETIKEIQDISKTRASRKKIRDYMQTTKQMLIRSYA